MNFMNLIRNQILPKSFLPAARNLRFYKSSSLLSQSFLFGNEGKLVFSHIRKYSANHNIPNIDPQQEKRRKGLTILTYLSGFIGACLLTAVGARQYQRLKLRARGIEPVKTRLHGRRPNSFHYRGYVLPRFAIDVIDGVHTFEVREDDIWIVTFPKAGTTWLQEIVYLIVNDGDFESAKSNIEERIPYFEYIYPGLKSIDSMPSPRCIKTHLPFSLLPNDHKEKRPKTIYLARNQKDTLVSYYFFVQKFFGKFPFQETSFDDYCQAFVNNEEAYSPWWKHLKEGWGKRNEDNVLFITYEDMQEDLPAAIKAIASFLGKTLSPQDIQALAFHCSFEEMKNNNFVNYSWFKDTGVAKMESDFMRKGKVGDWKNHLSKEVVAKMDEIEKTKLEPLGLTLRDSLDDEV